MVGSSQDVGPTVGAKLEEDFLTHFANKNQMHIESKICNIRYLGELTKFRVCPGAMPRAWCAGVGFGLGWVLGLGFLIICVPIAIPPFYPTLTLTLVLRRRCHGKSDQDGPRSNTRIRWPFSPEGGADEPTGRPDSTLRHPTLARHTTRRLVPPSICIHPGSRGFVEHMGPGPAQRPRSCGCWPSAWTPAPRPFLPPPQRMVKGSSTQGSAGILPAIGWCLRFQHRF